MYKPRILHVKKKEKGSDQTNGKRETKVKSHKDFTIFVYILYVLLTKPLNTL